MTTHPLRPTNPADALVWDTAASVPDPEIPVVSIADLGILRDAAIIDGMVSRIEAELGEKCTVIATGGLSALVAPLCQTKLILDDDLLLKGLMLIYRKNTEK